MYDDSVMDSFHVLTPEDMRQTEQMAFGLGVPSLLLMEHAAIAVVDEMEKLLGGSCRLKRVLFLCGNGNNGGDGLAAARLFAMRQGIATVYMTGEPKTPDAKTNWKWAHEMGIGIVNLRSLPEEELPFAESGFRLGFDGIVDALLGTGLHGAPEALTARLIDAANSDAFDCHVPVVAVDIPSGLDGETGAAPGAFVRADSTVTFHAPKRGLYLTNQREAVGRLVIADIGLWEMAYGTGVLDKARSRPFCSVHTPAALRYLGRRRLAAHKGDCGRVLIYAGSLGMAGAAAMAARAAVTAGAGLVTVACEKAVMPILQTLVPNAMCMDIEEAVDNPPAYDVLALGCGLGQSEEIWRNILKLYDPQRPAVWDADALNLLALHPMKLGNQAVITPHAGEAARLLGTDAETVLKDRLAAARRLTEAFGCVAVLKSDVSVICSGSQEESVLYLNAVGSPALAKGGSGDALTGVLAAVIAGRKPIETGDQTAQAAALACLWHGMAGIVGEEKFGQRELTTDQLIACLGDAEKWGRGEVPAPACCRDRRAIGTAYNW